MKNYTLDLPVIVKGLVVSIKKDVIVVDVEGSHHKVPTKAWDSTSSALSVGDEVRVLLAPVSGLILSIGLWT